MTEDKDMFRAITALIENYRDTCLWFMRTDFVPTRRDEMLTALDHIEKHADRAGYVQARKLKRWLLQNSSAISAI